MKSIKRRLFSSLYIVAMIACLLMVVKPGTALFFSKQTIDKQGVVPDTGFAYRYKITVNPLFYRVSGSLLFEDGQALIPSQGNLVVDTGNGNFSIAESPHGERYLYFSSSDNSDPTKNNREYRLYLPISFISRQLGSFYLLILLSPLVWFLVFTLSNPINRKSLLRFQKGLPTVINNFFDLVSQRIGADAGMAEQTVKSRLVFWKRLFSGTVIVAYIYVLLEWIFFVTMPSFMSIMDLWEKIKILLLSGLAISLPCISILILYLVADLIALRAHRSRLSSNVALLLPTAIVSVLSILLIDNFTYTIFKFGISGTSGIWRGAYALLFILLVSLTYNQIRKMLIIGEHEKAISTRRWNWFLYISLGMVVVSTGIALANLNLSGFRSIGGTPSDPQAVHHPNILLLGSDGLNANHLSAYGYGRNTTPRLKELAQSSLVAENAYPNAGTTTGSIVSLMTGKFPTKTRVLYPPNILTGSDTFEHLPGILKNQGYKTVEFGTPYFVDAYNYNFQDAFDMVNNRTQGESKLYSLGQNWGFSNVAYFIDKLSGRVSDRLLHIFYLKEMQNPYTMVIHPVENISDQQKIDQTLELFDQTEAPLFVHVHLFGTHGPRFAPPVQVYSKGQEQDQEWMKDFYDDTILSFDQYVGEVIDHLKASGQIENTILVIYTDHNYKYHGYDRIPLIIHFPGNDYTSKITGNVENMDIAPTLLDYLGIEKPAWMDGESLLNGNLDPHRLIFISLIASDKVYDSKRYMLDPERLGPPFYQFGYVNIIDCHKWYSVELLKQTWLSGDVIGHTSPCNAESLYNKEELKQALIERLSMDGFDISSLQK